jgi:hypothetical protein
VLFALNLLEGRALRLATKVFLDGFQVRLSLLLLWVVVVLHGIDHLKVFKVLNLKVFGHGF